MAGFVLSPGPVFTLTPSGWPASRLPAETSRWLGVSQGDMTMATNQEMLQRRANAVPRGVGTAMPFYAAKAENAELWDIEGNRYIDFAGGIAVLNTGHRHPKVMKAVEQQMGKFTHTAFQVVAYDSYITLAERLNK